MTQEPEGKKPENSAPDWFELSWRRANDHRIVQWSLTYVALAYGVQHGVALTSEAFEWPHAVERFSMLLLALGLPFAVTFAWFHGRRASRHFSPAELTIMSILLMVGAVLFYAFARPGEDISAGSAKGARGVEIASLGQSFAKADGLSIAVLPLANLSGDDNQEFFSDGMTDEITSALAKVRVLHVVGRSSAFQFKGQNKDLRAVGRALSAHYLIDGSVRKAGERVRISAQLVEADNGVQLWSENYDRELKDVFAVQEDIAQAIAASLRVPLGLHEGESLVPSRTANLESYEDYLRARTLLRARAAREPGGPLTEAAALLEKVVARDPEYAPAWALLAQVYGFIPAFGSIFFSGSPEELKALVDAWLPKAEAAAERAVRLRPNSSDAYSSLGAVQFFRGKLLLADASFNRALAVDPGNPDALHLYSTLLGNIGKLKQATAIRQQLQALEPFVQVFSAITADYLWLGGQKADAMALLRRAPPEHPFVARQFALMYASDGDFGRAADALLKASGPYDPKVIASASEILRSGPQRTTPSDPRNTPNLGYFSLIYNFTGTPERALDNFTMNLDAGLWDATDVPKFWHPSFAALRKTERFKALVRKVGLLDYWRARGWPDVCHAVGADDFACE